VRKVIDNHEARPFSRLREKVSREGATDEGGEGPHPTLAHARATLSRKRERG
jgi:hypothetical protein